jgi:hypothetical protein
MMHPILLHIVYMGYFNGPEEMNNNFRKTMLLGTMAGCGTVFEQPRQVS